MVRRKLTKNGGSLRLLDLRSSEIQSLRKVDLLVEAIWPRPATPGVSGALEKRSYKERDENYSKRMVRTEASVLA